MEKDLKEKVIGQQKLLVLFQDVFYDHVGIQDPNRPMGIFILGTNRCR